MKTTNDLSLTGTSLILMNSFINLEYVDIFIINNNMTLNNDESKLSCVWS